MSMFDADPSNDKLITYTAFCWRQRKWKPYKYGSRKKCSYVIAVTLWTNPKNNINIFLKCLKWIPEVWGSKVEFPHHNGSSIIQTLKFLTMGAYTKHEAHDYGGQLLCVCVWPLPRGNVFIPRYHYAMWSLAPSAITHYPLSKRFRFTSGFLIVKWLLYHGFIGIDMSTWTAITYT